MYIISLNNYLIITLITLKYVKIIYIIKKLHLYKTFFKLKNFFFTVI